MRITVPARNVAKAEDALAEVPLIDIAKMDLADLKSVRSFADQIGEYEEPIDLLVNNAGVMASPLNRIGKGWESQFAINHIGHFVLTLALLPALRRADSPRVVVLSSLAHRVSPVRFEDPFFEREPYEKWAAYGQSKTANALFARELDKREEGILAVSVHPGGIMTDLQRHLTKEEQIERGWIDESGEISERAAPFFKTPAQGAATTLWAATSPMLEGHGGGYCEDCNIAALVRADEPGFWGVRPWAARDEDAARLWHMTEALL
jgi:NAD(P)-dependent dehydrogenase (short-subunit alcohol dehydrogenase family)